MIEINHQAHLSWYNTRSTYMDLINDLQRFLEPQKHAYPRALAEIRNGRKTSH